MPYPARIREFFYRKIWNIRSILRPAKIGKWYGKPQNCTKLFWKHLRWSIASSDVIQERISWKPFSLVLTLRFEIFLRPRMRGSGMSENSFVLLSITSKGLNPFSLIPVEGKLEIIWPMKNNCNSKNELSKISSSAFWKATPRRYQQRLMIYRPLINCKHCNEEPWL